LIDLNFRIAASPDFVLFGFNIFVLNFSATFCSVEGLQNQGRRQTFSFGGPLEGPVLQQGELSLVCVGLSERDLKIFGGPGKLLGGKWLPLAHP